MVHRSFEVIRKIVLLCLLLSAIIIFLIFLDSERDNINSLRNQPKVLQVDDISIDEDYQIIKINPPPHTLEVRLSSHWEGIVAANFNQNGGFVRVKVLENDQVVFVLLKQGDGKTVRHSLWIKGKEVEKTVSQYPLNLRGRRF